MTLPLVSAQLWLLPASIAVTPLESPETSTGSELFVVVPSPMSEEVKAPALDRPAARQRADVTEADGDRGHAPLESPETSTGVELFSMVVPFPLPGVVVAPALGRAPAREGAAVDAARRDGGHPTREPGNVDRDRADHRRRWVRVLGRVLANVVARDRPEPPLVSAQLWNAPTAIADPAPEPGNIDRDRAVRGRPVPELTEGVGAPALDRAPALSERSCDPRRC